MTEPRQDRLTQAQRARLAVELAELEGPRRAEVVQAIKTAREHGDLSENFEYHAAKNEQGMLEARIRTLRARLDHGECLLVVFLCFGGVGAVSPDSPLGSALLGASVGDAVDVAAPRGQWTARVLSIG